MSAVNNELALFHTPPMERAVSEVKWETYSYKGSLSKNSPVQFEVLGTSSEYMLLNRSRISLKLKILREDGVTAVDTTDNVALSNLSLHSLFRQADVFLNQQLITSTVGVNYPYKAMFDVLLNYPHQAHDTLLTTEGYAKDLAGK